MRLKGLTEPIDVIKVRPELEDLAQDVAFRRALGPSRPSSRGLETRNPYKGLRAFEEADAADFFGREALTEHLVERLARDPLPRRRRAERQRQVVGGPGRPRARRCAGEPCRAPRPGRSSRCSRAPIRSRSSRRRCSESPIKPPASLIEQLEDGRARAAARAQADPPDDGSELVLVLDQLEEVFTLVEDEERRTHFLAILERAVDDPHSRLRVVTTLRADFYDRPLLYSGFAELLRDYVEAVVPLTPDEFERAITGPAERVGVTLEPGLLAGDGRGRRRRARRAATAPVRADRAVRAP